MAVGPDDVKRIVNSFLLNAPPGEFHEVVTDVRGLLSNDGLLNELAPTAFKEYNTEQMLVLAVPNQPHKVLITKFGEVSGEEYLDTTGKQVVTFDHFKQEVTGTRAAGDAEFNSELEPWRTATEKKALEYVANFYDNGAGAVYCSKDGKGNIVVTFAISSALFNGTNFYNGRWRSVWTATFAPGKAAQVTGNLRINVHYYEDGNVQLNTNCNKKETVQAAKPDSFADAFVLAIQKLEGELQGQLGQNYDKMNTSTFKALRRALPITATKIAWPKITSYKIGTETQAPKS